MPSDAHCFPEDWWWRADLERNKHHSGEQQHEKFRRYTAELPDNIKGAGVPVLARDLFDERLALGTSTVYNRLGKHGAISVWDSY